VSSQFSKHVGMQWQNQVLSKGIGGVGGEVQVLGQLNVPIKLGKHQVNQGFLVVREPIAGYECLLGQGFLRTNACGIFFTPHSVSLSLGCDSSGLGQVLFTRCLDKSVPTICDYDEECMLPIKLRPSFNESEHEPISIYQREKKTAQ
jgi:hypothetical protein